MCCAASTQQSQTIFLVCLAIVHIKMQNLASRFKNCIGITQTMDVKKSLEVQVIGSSNIVMNWHGNFSQEIRIRPLRAAWKPSGKDNPLGPDSSIADLSRHRSGSNPAFYMETGHGNVFLGSCSAHKPIRSLECWLWSLFTPHNDGETKNKQINNV